MKKLEFNTREQTSPIPEYEESPQAAEASPSSSVEDALVDDYMRLFEVVNALMGLEEN